MSNTLSAVQLARVEALLINPAFVSEALQKIGPLCADMVAASLVGGDKAGAGAFLTGMVRGHAIATVKREG